MVNRMNNCPLCNNNFSSPCRNGSISKRNSCSMNDNYLLKKLQTVDFSLVDIVLYLDAYPNCSKALHHYHKLLEERASLLQKLNEAGIPLTSFGNTEDSWKWTDSPWPWEYDANV